MVDRGNLQLTAFPAIHYIKAKIMHIFECLSDKDDQFCSNVTGIAGATRGKLYEFFFSGLKEFMTTNDPSRITHILTKTSEAIEGLNDTIPEISEKDVQELQKMIALFNTRQPDLFQRSVLSLLSNDKELSTAHQ